MATRKKPTRKKPARKKPAPTCDACKKLSARERGLATSDVLGHLWRLAGRMTEAVDRNLDGDPAVSVRAAAEAGRLLELVARLRGDIDSRSQVTATVNMQPQPQVVLLAPSNGRGRVPPEGPGVSLPASLGG